MVGIDSFLRPSDLLRLTVADITNPQGKVLTQATIRQTKTRHTVEVYFTLPTQNAVAKWIEASDKSKSDLLFTRLRSQLNIRTPISAGMYRMLIKEWVSAIGLDPRYYSGKTLRKTRVKPILQAASYDLQTIQKLLGHQSILSTVAYCDLAQDKAKSLAEQVQFFRPLQSKQLIQNSTINGE